MSPFHCPSRRHWGELNIDHAENIPVAKRYGVLKEGIPNIKLFGVGAACCFPFTCFYLCPDSKGLCAGA